MGNKTYDTFYKKILIGIAMITFLNLCFSWLKTPISFATRLEAQETKTLELSQQLERMDTKLDRLLFYIAKDGGSRE